MKYVIVLCDGMADYPIEALGGKTPLEAAVKPNIDRLSERAEIGIVKTVPDGMKPGSDTANLSALGYDARACYTGRSPLEAISLGINLADDDVAIRCNLVTLSDEEDFAKKRMVDYSAGEISTAESGQIVRSIEERFGTDRLHFYPGVSYRHCLIVNHSKLGTELTPPHDISKKVVGEYMPKGVCGKEFCDLYVQINAFLKTHPVNLKRIADGKHPANSIWLWGEGTKPQLDSLQDKYGRRGGMISAVDLLKGIAISAGMKVYNVDGATGTVHTNFDGKAQAAIKAFNEGCDFVFIHLEAPDECGHQGDLAGKIRSIELIDQKIIGTVSKELEARGEQYAMLVMPDHYTPVSILTHSREPVPFMLFCSNNAPSPRVNFCEKSAAQTGLYYASGPDLAKVFYSKK